MEKISFESKMKQLEEVVRKLENKDLPLEEAVKLYMDGMKLSEDCYKVLNENEKLVLKQMSDSGLEDLEIK